MAPFVLGLACGGTTPVVEPPPDLPDVQPDVDETPLAADERLPLGTLQIVEMHSEAPTVTLRVVFDAGSAEDPAGREGITNLTARVMSEGGAGDLSFREISERLYPMAASVGAQVDREQTAFEGRVHRDHLDAFYGIFRDVIGAPRFASEDFARVKAQVESALELELRGNDDEELGKEMLQAMLYEGHPYGHPTLGTVRGLDAITLDDVRAHRNRVFCAGRATLGLAGGYSPEFLARVRADLERLAWDTCVGARRLTAPANVTAPRIWLVDKPEAGSVAISMGLPIPVTRSHPDYPALVLATSYLGQHRQFAGVLMQKMRGDRGLNYGDYAYAEHFVQDGHTRFPLPNVARRQQYFSVWIRPVQPEQAHFALRMAIRELELFARDGISQEDFERIQRFVERYFALFAQTAQQRLGNLLDDTFYGVPGPHLDVLRAKIRGLTREQVNAAVKRHFDPSKLQVALVSPQGDKFAAALVKGEPSPIVYASEKPKEILEEDKIIAGYPLQLTAEQVTVIPVGQVFK
jgi:zinc protease